MKFFLDENFPKSAAEFLRQAGHDVTSPHDEELLGVPDEVLFGRCQEIEACFLTTDRDFFHTVPHLYENHFGVVVIALKQPNRSGILSRLEWFLSHVAEETVPDRVFQLRDQSWHVRPPMGE